MTLKMNHLLHLKTQDPEKTVQFYVDTREPVMDFIAHDERAGGAQC